MEEIISKEEINRLMKVPGEVRGIGPKNIAEFVFREKGKEGLEKIEEVIAKLGYPIKYKEIKPMDFYPVGLVAVTEIIIKKLFCYDDKKFREIGEFEVKSSPIRRLFIQYFISIKKLAQGGPNIWRRYHNSGDLKVVELDSKKRYAIVRLENFPLHPLHCQYHIGYLSTISQLVVGKKTTCQETKCNFRGDKYHEFLIKW